VVELTASELVYEDVAFFCADIVTNLPDMLYLKLYDIHEGLKHTDMKGLSGVEFQTFILRQSFAT